MGRPKKYPDDDPYASQKTYLKSSKGKIARKKYESSDRSKERKRNWWLENKSPKRSDRRQNFIDTYGDIEAALKLLDKRSRFVIIHLNGLDGNKPMTQKAIAEELFLTPQRISQVNKDALKLLAPLKQELESNKPQI